MKYRFLTNEIKNYIDNEIEDYKDFIKEIDFLSVSELMDEHYFSHMSDDVEDWERLNDEIIDYIETNYL